LGDTTVVSVDGRNSACSFGTVGLNGVIDTGRRTEVR